MAKKLDNSVLNTLVTDFDKQYSLAETTLYEVYKTLSVLTKSLNFRGTAAEAQKTFIQQTSMNYGYVLLDITKSLKDYVHLAKDGFLEFESEASGKVNQQTISDNRASLSDIAKQIVELSGKLSLPERNARQEGASIASTGASDLENLFLAIDKGLETVSSDFDVKDSDLKVKSETILDSIQELQDNFSNITNAYIKKSGKYDSHKISQLTTESWYLKGDYSVFANKQKEDPYLYHTAHNAWLEEQYALGLFKDMYAYFEDRRVYSEAELKVKNGTTAIKAKGGILKNKLEVKAAEFATITSSTTLLGGSAEARFKNGLVTPYYGNLQLDGFKSLNQFNLYKNTLTAQGNIKVLSANGEAGVLVEDNKWFIGTDAYATAGAVEGELGVFNNLFKVQGEASLPSAKLKAGLIADEETFFVGIDTDANLGSAEGGVKMLNVNIEDIESGKFKSIFGIDIITGGEAGAGITAALSGQELKDDVWNIEWLDINVYTLQLGGALGVKGQINVTIPFFGIEF